MITTTSSFCESFDFRRDHENGHTVFSLFSHNVLGFPMPSKERPNCFQCFRWCSWISDAIDRMATTMVSLLNDIFNHITNKSPVNGYFLCCCMNVDNLGQPFPLRGRGSSLGCLDLISNKTHTNMSANPKLHRLPRDTSWNKFLRQSVGVGCRHAMANATKNLCVLMTPCKHFPTLQQCYEI